MAEDNSAKQSAHRGILESADTNEALKEMKVVLMIVGVNDKNKLGVIFTNEGSRSMLDPRNVENFKGMLRDLLDRSIDEMIEKEAIEFAKENPQHG